VPIDSPSGSRPDLLDPGTASSEIISAPSIPETRTSAQAETEAFGYVRSLIRNLNGIIDERHHESYAKEWNVRTSELARSSSAELLAHVTDLGFAWRDIARLLGVTVQAIQKWRRGANTSGENRRNIAGLLAACAMLSENYGIQEVASWFEMPLLQGLAVTPIDLWASDRPDLVFDYGSGHGTDPEQILTNWDPQWRERYRSDFEVFRAEDDQLSIRPKDM
jgi:hypothetical protein